MLISERIREIPYNYTSFSDREIVLRLLGESAWHHLNNLREHRRTGRSARMLFEILGDIWVVERNPYIQTDLISNPKRKSALIAALQHRLKQINDRATEHQPDVNELVTATRHAINKFEVELEDQKFLQIKALKAFSKYTKKDNICFDGGSRIAHSTDATDWRVECPFCVLKPDSEAELLPLIQACIKLDLTIVVRGGGTGYTGGAIPLHKNSVVINTEKLQDLSRIDYQWINNEQVAIVRAEAGVVTRRISDLAASRGLVFAVDPTSQDASTIGGNIAMNAGGKKAVLWGTTLDNLLSWRMITPDCRWLEVRRLNHNLGKIHEQETVEFSLTRYEADGKTPHGSVEFIKIPGKSLRKIGLGKDVTDKFLQGLPGIQKEGCDGLITSAEFILHQPPKYIRTVCLEFFGSDLQQATPAIVEVKDYIDNLPEVFLAGLEHLDQRYLRAVKYNTRASRPGLPKMVLLADISSNDENAVSKAASEIIKLVNLRQGEGFVAVSPEARKRFWLDRTRTAAIAAHTNAFKINEDVVIPLEKLNDYSNGIEHINIEYSLINKIAILEKILRYLRSDKFIIKTSEDMIELAEYKEIVENKKNTAIAHVEKIKGQWQTLLNNLDANAGQYHDLSIDPRLIKDHDTLFDLLQRHDLIVSYKKQVATVLNDIFSGSDFKVVRQKFEKLHAKILKSRLFVALHMHAGDGNVHTNIPVNSSDYEMLQAADKIVVRVMALAKSLGGVISGEHGIGITKMEFVEPEMIAAFTAYKQQVDPRQYFNRDKLQAGSGLMNAYTPSLQLVQQEALLLEASELGDLNNDIKDCLRCGKCKPVCMTHVPRANLFYSPRDKILATGAIIEAFLYEEQTRRGVSLNHFEAMNDVADHCTTCHKCFNPCPVNIDFGDVSIKMRNILQRKKKKNINLGTKLSMAFLNVNKPTIIKLLRVVLMDWGFAAQRLLNHVYHLFVKKEKTPPATTGKTPMVEQVMHFIKRPMPKGLPSKTMRAIIGAEDDKVVAVVRDPKNATENSPAVFYFPGCGSERLFSQVGLATIAMLYHTGAQVVLPPGYLCCGYPQNAVGDGSKANEISVANQVLFHRMANTLNYLDIKTVLVSCGTCIDQLQKYQFEKIFPGCRLLDIHEYLMENGMKLQANETKYIYHDPCHSPMKQHNPLEVTKKLLGSEVIASKYCCGDAGTLSMSRPDIATQLKFRKSEELQRNKEQLDAKEVKILTSCPACLKGLSSYRQETGLKADYIVVELAYRLLGKQWQHDFINAVQQGGVERVLL